MSFIPTRRAGLRGLLLLAAAAGSGCITTDDGRAQQVLNQRGFGVRYTGDSNVQYYLGVGDRFTVTDEQHPEFNDIFTIRSDGVIDPKGIGDVFVAGLTVPDVEETLTRRYREFNTTAQIEVQLVGSASKFYYVEGEVQGGGRKRFDGDTTLFQVIFEAAPTLLADDDNVRLIRADPYHPLAIDFDYDDMLEGGWSRNNIEVRENDIIYVPPNVFGYLTIFTQRIFSPLQVIVVSLLSINRAIFAVETLGDTNRFVGFGRGRGRFGALSLAPAKPPPLEMALAPVDPGRLGNE